MKALFDTNILIDYLSGRLPAQQELAKYSRPAISIITWMEVMVGAEPAVEAGTRGFLSRFDRIELDEAIASRAVDLRRVHRIKLPDAVIWATARERSLLLVTRNVKDFPPDDPGVRMPYTL